MWEDESTLQKTSKTTNLTVYIIMVLIVFKLFVMGIHKRVWYGDIICEISYVDFHTTTNEKAELTISNNVNLINIVIWIIRRGRVEERERGCIRDKTSIIV